MVGEGQLTPYAPDDQGSRTGDAVRGVDVNAPGRGLVVLIVDDDLGDVILIQEALELAGHVHAIHVANDGQEGVNFLRRSGKYAHAPRPDVVLLDLNMPRKNGRQVLAEIKSDRSCGASRSWC
jgi:CheY-like chemotaxis protein